MQKKKGLPGVTLRCFAVCLGIITGMISTNSVSAQGTVVCSSGDCYSCQLHATSVHNPIGTTIYDDGLSNWGTGCTYAPGTNNGAWNCARSFLFTEYIGTNDTIQLTFQYAGPELCSSPTDSGYHDLYIYNNTRGELLTPSPIVIADLDDSSPFPTVYILPSIYTTTPGELQLSFFRHNHNRFGIDQPDITGRIILIPQIQQFWITANPICSDFSGTQYNFQIHSIPPFDSIMQSTYSFAVPSCDLGDFYAEMSLQFASTAPINHFAWPNYWDGVLFDTNEVAGNFWIYPGDTTDMTDLWINYSDLAPYLNGGSSYGSSYEINMSVFDGISTFYASAPLIIETPASSPGPIYAGVTPVGFPPQASGTPSSSYDFLNYTVSGSETWTPSSNPLVTLIGGDGEITDSVIRIQDTLYIPAGCTLNLTGMTLEFGPNAVIAAYPAATSTGIGGNLNLSYSTLTAYRGCNGTDSSLWGGIVLYGNPSWPFGYNPLLYNSPQGRLNMFHSTISYADTAIMNGTNSTNTGGAVYSTGENTLYNNKLDVYLLPYAPPVTAGETEAELDFFDCTFLNDSSAWFSSANMIYALSSGTLNLTHATLTNNTGNKTDVGVFAEETSLLVNEANISNFYYGINSWFASGTHALNVRNSTFTNNHMGLISYGGIAPYITGNTFNIPHYNITYTPSPYYANSNVQIVDDQNVGVVMSATTGYNLYENTFQTVAADGSYFPYTTGTLEYNTGSDTNWVTGNTFDGVGVAMLSNFVNNRPPSALRSSESGLIYSCNTDAHIGYDIAALGATSGLGGIASAQGTDIYLGGAIMATGNVLDGSDYNLYNTQQMFNYNYDHLITDQRPIRYTIPKVNLTSSSEQGECPSGTIILPTNGTITTTGLGSAHYSLAAANINYYMTSKRAASHRDSLYYWAGQLGTAYGDLLTTNLLIEDGYTDSAQNIYDSIINKYALDSNSTEGNDFVQGRNLIDLLVYKQLNSEPLMTLTTTEISALKSITANSQMWAHVRAENWLYAYEGDPITDTLLYPNPSDTGNVDSTQRKANLTGYNQSSKIPNQVFPNPAHDQLEVIYTALTNDPITIEIQDISGRTIITQSLQSGVTASVNISNLVPGMYLYRIMEGPNTTMIGKVAKE